MYVCIYTQSQGAYRSWRLYLECLYTQWENLEYLHTQFACICFYLHLEFMYATRLIPDGNGQSTPICTARQNQIILWETTQTTKCILLYILICTCICAYIDVCMYEQMNVHKSIRPMISRCVYTYTYVCVYIHMCACVCVCVCKHVYIYVYINTRYAHVCIHRHARACVCVLVLVHMYRCICIYTCLCTFTYVYHIYIHVFT